MVEHTEAVSTLLHEAAETHHRVYRIVDGADPDWVSCSASAPSAASLFTCAAAVDESLKNFPRASAPRLRLAAAAR